MNDSLQKIVSDLRITLGRLEEAIASVQEAIVLTDLDGRLEWCNKSFDYLIGKLHITLAGEQLTKMLTLRDEKGDLISPEKYPHFETINKGFSAGIYECVNDNGTVKLMRIFGKLIGFEGKNSSVLLTFYDITEQKHLDQLKDEFISTVSHEFRTPLTVIHQGLANLQDGYAGPILEKQSTVIKRNIRNVERLTRLVNNILDLSKLKSGKYKLRAIKMELVTFIGGILENFKSVYEKLSFVEEYDKEMPIVEIDPDSITQVLTNLFANAVRYAREEIIIKTRTIKGRENNPQFVQICVQNDGPTIPVDKLKDIFTAFIQLDSKNKNGLNKGSGLGLSICEQIVVQHGGNMWANNLNNKGVQFCFTLPVEHKNGGQ